jgi:hypothetical protein
MATPSPAQPAPTTTLPFGDYLVFVDESGDHELGKIDPQYPVFVLLFVIMSKRDYVETVCRDMQRFKLTFWGHDEVVLHEHEIRKPKGDFLILFQQTVRERFVAELTKQISALPATLVAVLIDKPRFVGRYHNPVSPYDYALETGLERVYRHLESLGQSTRQTPVIVEARGRKEDNNLELAFRRVRDGSNFLSRPLPFQIVMVPKSANSAGLQLADLMARPVGLHHLRPGQENRAFDLIQPKLRRSPIGKIEGWGLKIIP